MLAFAKCMREHGVDMPDPEFGSGGTTVMIGGDGIAFDSPTFKAANEACRSIMTDAMPGLVSGGAGGTRRRQLGARRGRHDELRPDPPGGAGAMRRPRFGRGRSLVAVVGVVAVGAVAAVGLGLLPTRSSAADGAGAAPCASTAPHYHRDRRPRRR